MNAIDTNVPVYAVSTDEPIKGPAAMRLLDGLAAADTVLLWQVACEFGAVLARLRAQGRTGSDPFAAVAAYRARFPLVLPGPGVLDLGLRIHEEAGVAYWDAMLIAACADAGVERLYSEDVPAVRSAAGVDVVNPFVPDSRIPG